MGKRLLPWRRKLPIEPNGTCRSCDGEFWTITVVFVDSTMELEKSVVRIGLATAVGGIGFVKSSTYANETAYPNVSASVVAILNEYPPARMQRVAEFARVMERERLKELGGRECVSCGALFVPSPDKPWCGNGFCSKACSADEQGTSGTVVFDRAEEPESPMSRTIRVCCPTGHDFDVPISFRGLARPCPECGTKTVVQDVES